MWSRCQGRCGSASTVRRVRVVDRRLEVVGRVGVLAALQGMREFVLLDGARRLASTVPDIEIVWCGIRRGGSAMRASPGGMGFGAPWTLVVSRASSSARWGSRSCMTRRYWGMAYRGSAMWMLCHPGVAIVRVPQGGGAEAAAAEGAAVRRPRRRGGAAPPGPGPWSTGRNPSRVVVAVVCMCSTAAGAWSQGTMSRSVRCRAVSANGVAVQPAGHGICASAVPGIRVEPVHNDRLLDPAFAGACR